MAKEKKPVHKVQMTDGKRQIIQQLLCSVYYCSASISAFMVSSLAAMA